MNTFGLAVRLQDKAGLVSREVYIFPTQTNDSRFPLPTKEGKLSQRVQVRAQLR